MNMDDEAIFLTELLKLLEEYNLQGNLYKRELCYDEGIEEILYYVRVPRFWSKVHENKVFKNIHESLYEFCKCNNLMDFLKNSCIIFT